MTEKPIKAGMSRDQGGQKFTASSADAPPQREEPEVRPEKLLYSVNEVLHVTGFGRNTFYNSVNSGALNAVKLGTRTFVHVDELHRFLRSLPAIH